MGIPKEDASVSDAQGTFDLGVGTAGRPPVGPPMKDTSDAKRSIDYLLRMALDYGAMQDLDQLLDQVVRLRPYKPFNALLVLLQIPHATLVLPAHHWEERYRRRIKPGQQPIVMLQPRGPV